jgi:hypothetical protein
LTIGSMVKNIPSSSIGAGARAPVVQHVGRGVKHPPQAVAAEIAHHGHALGLDEVLDRISDIAKGVAGLYGIDTPHQALRA